jgi:prepilin-type N-terminal cleavage/methylation domain-containing protein
VEKRILAGRPSAGRLRDGRGTRGDASGFSMVELLITLVLFGIVLAIAIPSYRGWVDNSNLKGAGRMLSSDFYDSRGRAMAENRSYTITYNPDPANTYRIQAAAATGLAAVDDTKPFAEYWTVRMARVNGGAAAVTITIQPRGSASTAATIGITNVRNSTGTITVLMTGRAHVTYTMQ